MPSSTCAAAVVRCPPPPNFSITTCTLTSPKDLALITVLFSVFLPTTKDAQYLDGTTDITRTIALGKLTEEEKTDYTLILKGHIDLAMAVFPEGTRGAQLDVLARMPIWQYRFR